LQVLNENRKMMGERMSLYRTGLLFGLLLMFSMAPPVQAAAGKSDVVHVRMTTSMGVINLDLNRARAPKTVANFLRYVNEGFYNGTIFHRVIPDFMIQGGGFTPAMRQKQTHAPIRNEADNGLKNIIGTIAMARTGDPNSATAQFFINTHNNAFLDFRSKTPRGWGYAVFGEVTAGMRTVRKIEATQTATKHGFQNVPVKDVLIQKIEVVKIAKQVK